MQRGAYRTQDSRSQGSQTLRSYSDNAPEPKKGRNDFNDSLADARKSDAKRGAERLRPLLASSPNLDFQLEAVFTRSAEISAHLSHGQTAIYDLRSARVHLD